ncbi:ElaD/SseL family deubiquitinase [Lonsdalea quercina]|uniref:ElaD/SseL family deubiquitinase n=1 Tax=Lonsdalea quercina TaxID=71657 RepID=UPI003F460015
MITNEFSLSPLDINQFHGLFTDNIDQETLALLGKSATDGNLDSIDILFNLALRTDNIGNQSERILFDLFSGETKGKKGIDKDIQQASLNLYHTAIEAKEKNNIDMGKLYSPSGVLYMAGSAMTSKIQRQELTNLFTRGFVSQSPEEQFDESDVWCSNRMINTDELYAAIKNKSNDDVSMNFPISLSHAAVDMNLLSEQIAESMTSPHFLDKTELFPVNTGDHWVLFGLYKDKCDGNIKSFVFNSTTELKEDVKEKFHSAADLAGVYSEKNLTFINSNMQENVPNGCGVFVAVTAGCLSTHRQFDPLDVLNTFVKEFTSWPAHDQTIFNIESRRQMYAHFLPVRWNKTEQPVEYFTESALLILSYQAPPMSEHPSLKKQKDSPLSQILMEIYDYIDEENDLIQQDDLKPYHEQLLKIAKKMLPLADELKNFIESGTPLKQSDNKYYYFDNHIQSVFDDLNEIYISDRNHTQEQKNLLRDNIRPLIYLYQALWMALDNFSALSENRSS